MIPVYAELERGSLEAVPSGESMEAFHKAHSMNDFIQELIKRGLRAQLDMQSIVTGQLMVSLDFYSDRSATLVGADTRYPEIPTIPTTMQQLAERLEKIPIDEIVAKLNSALGGIDKLVNSPEMAGTIKSVRQAVDDTRSLVQNLDGQVKPLVAKMTDVATNIQTLATRIDSKIDPLATSITKASDEVAVTLKRAQTTMGTIEDLAGEDSMVTYRLEKTLEELESAARALKLLADTLQQQPDAIIFGKKNTRGK
jgi:paraquat-inducible protein B